MDYSIVQLRFIRNQLLPIKPQRVTARVAAKKNSRRKIDNLIFRNYKMKQGNFINPFFY
jgi:hypothetical protein